MNLDAVTLIFSCVAWLSAACVLVATWVVKHRRRRSRANRWLFAGLLLMVSDSVIGQVGQMLRWSFRAQAVVDDISFAFGVVVGGGCLIVGLIQVFRRTADRAEARP